MNNMHARPLSSPFFLSLTISMILIVFPNPTNSDLSSEVYAGCSPVMYGSGVEYGSTVTTILTSLVNSAAFSVFNNYSLPVGNQHNMIYALYQCRGDLSNTDCQGCVTNAVSRLQSYCVGAKGGEVQLDGCYVRYDNVTFFGVEEKNVISDRCGPAVGGDQTNFLAMRDTVLSYLSSGGPYFRVTGTGSVQGMAQCVSDLSVSECQDCVSNAIQRLRSECGTSSSGDMFLGSCYARYTSRGYSTYQPRNNNDNNNNSNLNDTDRTIAIVIGVVAGIILLIGFLSYISKKLDKKGDK